MPKTIIKVYFNNGCTTLIYNETTTVEVIILNFCFLYFMESFKLAYIISSKDIIRVVIKGRLSLNELRYKRCFAIRASRYESEAKNGTEEKPGDDKIDKEPKSEIVHWLPLTLTIKEWLMSLGDDSANWKCVITIFILLT